MQCETAALREKDKSPSLSKQQISAGTVWVFSVQMMSPFNCLFFVFTSRTLVGRIPAVADRVASNTLVISQVMDS